MLRQADRFSVNSFVIAMVAVAMLACVASSGLADSQAPNVAIDAGLSTSGFGSQPAKVTNTSTRGGNLLIITPPAYDGSAPLNEFIAAKTGMGFNVNVMSVATGTSRTTIQSNIIDLWGTANQPKYILIVGDTNGSTSTNDTIPHWTGSASRNADTDLYYGTMPGGVEWYPDIPVGRFSVSSVAELQNVVDKTLCVESGNFPNPNYAKRGAFLANPSTYGVAEPTHDWVISQYFDPRGYEGVKLYSSQGADTNDVIDAINEGCLFVLYFGHSGSSGWWDPSFSQSNIPSLTNEGMYPLAFGWSCNTAHFSYDECFGETWIREANKGAAAYLSASDYIFWGSVEEWTPSAELEKAFFSTIFLKDIWEVGPAWRGGLVEFLRTYGQWDGHPDHEPEFEINICRNFVEEFVLLGDPSLMLPQPFGFSVTSLQGEHSICTPPTTQVTYDIEVGQMGTFAESVRLSVQNVPAGCSVSFSVNNQVPPFSSVLTISNLDSTMEGYYPLSIRGGASSMVRSTEADLTISSGGPNPVTLVSPTNGEIDVDLRPRFEWQAQAGATSYNLEVATDSMFNNVVYSTTTAAASHTVSTSLNMLSEYYWHVSADNVCGQGDYGDASAFTTVNKLIPFSYDMQNGETGSYSYYDDLYDGDGDNGQSLAWLTNGLGELVDGVLATQHWNTNNEPYVGWKSIEPVITFNFAAEMNISSLTIHVDDDGGGGGVVPPSNVVIVMGGTELNFPVVDPAGDAPFAATFSDLGLTGTSLELTLEDSGFSSSRYMMLSEVEFEGTPNSGACCTEGTCEILSETNCLLGGGSYLGDAVGCDPNPCSSNDTECLIISEVVHGAESGGCPKWIEITNTGTEDYTFTEGGIIVQIGSDSDYNVDVDLAGQTVLAGESYVVNFTNDGECGGAYNFIYGKAPDFQTDALFGAGGARFILTNDANGADLLDIYGELGVDGSGTAWDYFEGYAYRYPEFISGQSSAFVQDEWFFSGTNSLAGSGPISPTEKLLTLTTPNTHAYLFHCGGELADLDLSGTVDLDDFDMFFGCISGPENTTVPGGCTQNEFEMSDVDHDGDVDLADFHLFQSVIPAS